MDEDFDDDDFDDEDDGFEIWWDRLEENLQFPFEAEVSKYQSNGPLQFGDKLRVTSIFDYDEHYGAIAEVRKGHKKYYFPLCDLEATDKKSENHKIVDEYAVWFANR